MTRFQRSVRGRRDSANKETPPCCLTARVYFNRSGQSRLPGRHLGVATWPYQGCALRRSELAALESKHIQQRDGRWVFVDLVGQGKRIRTVPIHHL